MIRMNPNSRTITPNTVMSYDWFNAIQDEVCAPIERKLELSPRLDQLATCIQKIMEGTGVDLGEIGDYSGNPVAIPGLVVRPGESISFHLYHDIALKKPIDLSVEHLPDAFKPFAWPPKSYEYMSFSNALYDLDTSSSNFGNIATILSSDDLLEKISSFGSPISNDHSIKGYQAIRLPEIPNMSRTDAISIVRKINSNYLIKRSTSASPYTFSLTEKGISHSGEFSYFADYGVLQALMSLVQPMLQGVPPEQWASASVSWPFYFFLTIPMPPVILAANPDGQIYYFFNKMIYGDLIGVKLGIFNQTRVSV